MLRKPSDPRRYAPDELLGRVVPLRVRRVTSAGALLAREGDDDRAAVLLPLREVVPKVGDELEVFVYLADDEPIATMTWPKVTRDEVAFLEVKDLTNFGAFVDWGLPKELLVPLDEQIRDVRVGERHPIGVYLDDTGRLAGTMRVTEMLKGHGEFAVGDWVFGEAWRRDPELGVFVIVEKRYVGLLPITEPHELSRGEAARFRVSHVHRDGKIELSLRGPAHEERENDAKKILDVLSRANAPRVSDRSDPDQLRALFGLSKKAFKRAVGGLLKTGAVVLDEQGHVTPVKR
jgi:predicted RNA-binding protein (virulence factor B family)